jgi:hypothetical protein
VTSSFEESEHLRKPTTLRSSIVFGSHDSSSKNCPVDKSKVEFLLSIGAPENALEGYHNLTVHDDTRCTKEIVKFSPVSLSESCKQSKFEEILAITDFNLNLKFERVSFATVE